jgi:hypothetical protein
MDTPDFFFFVVVYAVAFVIVIMITGYLLGIPKLIQNAEEQTALMKQILEQLKSEKQ